MMRKNIISALGSFVELLSSKNSYDMKAMCIVFFAFAAMVATEEPNETVVVPEEPKDEAAEEPKEIRDMKALQQAYAFAIPYGYAAPTKFAATPFANGVNSAKFAATPYSNAYTAAPYYGYAAPYYGYGYAAPVAFGAAPVAFAAPVKFTAQTYPFGATQPYQSGSTQTYPSGAANLYATYVPQYAGYQKLGFPYGYGYASNAYSFKFQDSLKEQSAYYLPENFPFAYPSFAGFPVASKE